MILFHTTLQENDFRHSKRVEEVSVDTAWVWTSGQWRWLNLELTPPLQTHVECAAKHYDLRDFVPCRMAIMPVGNIQMIITFAKLCVDHGSLSPIILS